MTPQQLKNSILQRAIEGRLVPQKAEEGTAKELLQKIQAEKAQLIAEKKIKKTKSLPPVSDEEIPFDIPDSWEWVRLGEVGLTNIGLTYKPTDITSQNGIIVLRSSNIQNDRLTYDDIVRVKIDIPENKMCSIGDILICARNGSKRLVGKAAIIEKDGMSFGAFMAIFKPLNIDSRYILYVINSAYFRNSLLKDTGTTTINQITQNMLKEFVLPLPPLSEQRRIVAKIEELIPLINKYDKAHTKLTEFNARFPEDMKKSILQYAIEGKLVEQRKEEGTADALLQQIQAEKKRLIEEKKIKKTKELPPISEEVIPFDIPDSWEWVRLDSVVYNHGQEKPDKPFSYIDIGAIDNKNQRLSEKENIIMPEKAPSRARKIIEKDDIIYSTVRPYLHNMCIIDRDFSHKPIASTGFAVMATYGGVNNRYLFYYLLSPSFDSYANSNDNAKGVAYPAINDKALYSAIVPLPPLAEQHRIAAKIEELLPLCDALPQDK